MKRVFYIAPSIRTLYLQVNYWIQFCMRMYRFNSLMWNIKHVAVWTRSTITPDWPAFDWVCTWCILSEVSQVLLVSHVGWFNLHMVHSDRLWMVTSSSFCVFLVVAYAKPIYIRVFADALSCLFLSILDHSRFSIIVIKLYWPCMLCSMHIC